MATTPYESFLNERFSAMCCQQKPNHQPISQRLLELSEKQRYQALHDLHGVMDDFEEPPDMVRKSLHNLEIELQKIGEKKDATSYYNKAVKMSPEYVRSQHLKFLRAKNFDSRQTAKLLERFFELKAKFFGESKLVRDITMSDLTVEDIECWKTGYLQVLSERDLSGRKVMTFFTKYVHEFPIDSTVRLLFILNMKCVENEIDQRKGIVAVALAYGQTSFDGEKVCQFFAARDSLPFKYAAVHQAFDNPYLHQFVPLVEAVMNTMEQCKHRIHPGSYIEAQYNLMSFGIPKDLLPMTADGQIDEAASKKNGSHLLEELNSRSSLGSEPIPPEPSSGLEHRSESEAEAGDGCLPKSYSPGDDDVVLGRQAQAVNSSGNIRLRHLLESCRTQYDTATHKMEKMVLTHHVFKTIKERGGRFVKQRPDKRWEEVPETAAREKVALGFRNLRRRAGGGGGSSGPSLKRRAK